MSLETTWNVARETSTTVVQGREMITESLYSVSEIGVTPEMRKTCVNIH